MKGIDLNKTKVDTRKTRHLTGMKKMEENIKNALLTPLGVRPNLPEFGSKIHYLQFELINEVMLDLLSLYIQECIAISVPQVSLLDIKYRVDRGRRKIRVGVEFRDISSGKKGVAYINYAGGEFIE